MNLQVRELTADTWPDFEKLFRRDRLTAQCFCLSHRVEPQDLVIEDEACARMKEWVCGASRRPRLQVVTGAAASSEESAPLAGDTHRKVNGLLLFDGDEAVGWIGVEPMESLPGHDAYVDRRDGEWAIHCVYLLPDYRQKNLSEMLIKNALELARSKGAKVVSAYPCPAEAEVSQPASLRFGGRMNTYLNLGFRSGSVLSSLCQRVEFHFDL